MDRAPWDVWDKAAHVAEFFPFGLLLALWLTERFTRLGQAAAVCTAAGISLAIGALDELHQSFVPGRFACVWDAVADAIGGAAGAGARTLAVVAKHRLEGRDP